MRHRAPFLTTLLILLGSSLCAQNSFIRPQAGMTISSDNATVEFSSSHAVDSIVLSLEYLSDKGTERKRPIGSFNSAPCGAKIPVGNIPDQYGQGATIVAEVYRQDDTLDITKVRNLYVQQNTHKKHPLIIANKPLPLTSLDVETKGYLTVRNQGAIVRVVAKIICPTEQAAAALIPQLTYFIVMDPEVSGASHPSNSTTMLQVPAKGAVNLFTHVIEPAPHFALKQSVTKLPMTAKVHNKANVLYARFDIPSYLLGSTIPDSWLLNFSIRKQETPLFSLGSPELPQLVAPRLMHEVKNK